MTRPVFFITYPGRIHALAQRYTLILEDDEMEARARAFRELGTGWAFIYEGQEELDRQAEMFGLRPATFEEAREHMPSQDAEAMHGGESVTTPPDLATQAEQELEREGRISVDTAEALIEAARNQGSEMERDALDHIMRTAQNSRSQTRRLRFIAERARMALEGEPYEEGSIEEPKQNPGPTPQAMDRQCREIKRERDALAETLERMREVSPLIDPDIEDILREAPPHRK